MYLIPLKIQEVTPRILRLFCCTLLLSISLLAIVQTMELFIYGPSNVKNSSLKSQADKSNIPPFHFNKSRIEHWNLFGNYRSTSNPQTAEFNETNLKIKLLGIFHTHDSQLGWAIISENGGESKLAQVGDKLLSGSILKSIYSNQIIIERSGIKESVYLQEFPQADKLSFAAKRKENQPNAEADSDKSDTPREQLLHSLHLVPVNEGTASGYRVTEKSLKLKRKHGLKEGDIIASINGYPLGTEDYDLLAADSFKQSGTAAVKINRSGTTITLNYPR